MTTQHQTSEEIAALKLEQEKQRQIPMALSFLMALIDRAGGEIIIENLSEFAGKRLGITMKVEEENDRVILKVAKLVDLQGSK